ncbi:haloacid dehalogenase-like hydrolase domain-containing protein 3 isoform X1 [Tachyglossus aculeatus]|uniref:haloacid dehalogenase-like hydrolase domain-containing protein 3 isoform X1 n=2 Tax=Tachyglossus aculeatus TaxID=9261 RepID=UPI0018F38B71|nr:haloacid dehalogenase-like hydrolase domain-containing protein 3 isoform X1 [Tachyglossus aculeatus]
MLGSYHSHLMASTLRLLTWDVKDTLLRLRRPVGEEYASQARAHGLQLEPAALSQAFHQAYKAQSQDYPNYGLSQGLSSRQWWMEVVRRTFLLAGISDAAATDPIANRLYRDFCRADTWEVVAGAAWTLQRCRERGLRLAVISNFDRRLEEILVHCGLRQHFEFVLTSEAAGWAKPDPRIFQEALRRARVSPAQAAHVGDHLLNDYQAARRAGMHSFLVTGSEPLSLGTGAVPSDHILPTLPHLLTVLDRLEGSNLSH